MTKDKQVARVLPATSDSKPRGRPQTRAIKLDATPEQIARAIFAAALPPDLKRRILRRKARSSI